MKIICSCETLASYFEVVRSIARIQSPKPILRNVKMEVRDEEIVLFATDMEMGARISFPCEQILEAGSRDLWRAFYTQGPVRDKRRQSCFFKGC